MCHGVAVCVIESEPTADLREQVVELIQRRFAEIWAAPVAVWPSVSLPDSDLGAWFVGLVEHWVRGVKTADSSWFEPVNPGLDLGAPERLDLEMEMDSGFGFLLGWALVRIL